MLQLPQSFFYNCHNHCDRNHKMLDQSQDNVLHVIRDICMRRFISKIVLLQTSMKQFQIGTTLLHIHNSSSGSCFQYGTFRRHICPATTVVLMIEQRYKGFYREVTSSSSLSSYRSILTLLQWTLKYLSSFPAHHPTSTLMCRLRACTAARRAIAKKKRVKCVRAAVCGS